MELRDYLRGLRRYLLWIILMVAVGAGVGYGWAQLQTPVFQATSDGLIQERDTPDAEGSLIGDTMARSKVQTYLAMSTWKMVAERTIADLGLDTTPEAINARVSTSNPTDTAILQVTARAPTAQDAAALADAWIVSISVAIDEVEGDGTAGSAPLTLYVASSASIPVDPIYPDPLVAVIVGGVLGLGVGIAFMLMRTISDRRIRAVDDIEARVHLPVIGSIPVSSELSGGKRLFDMSAVTGGKGARFAVAEALRALRTNLQFMDVDDPPRVIVVTSPLPADGKSTIACNLAQTLAAAGRPVVLIDGDLRRAALATTMGLTGGAGLTDVLSGRVELAEVMQRAPQMKNLFVLTAGSTPPNPSEVLGSLRMKKLLDDLAEHASVIIDAPPLLPVTDGAVLTHQSDGAIIVANAGKTTYDVLEKAVETLRKSAGRALGVVVNRAPLRGPDASPYTYAYRREYGTGSTLPDEQPRHDAGAGFDVGAAIRRGRGEADAAPGPRRGGRAAPAEQPVSQPGARD